jgi:2-polyprenyl-6-methoxyphenol hydroxylase-like FAD-dependent oxidoreductase
MDSASAPSSSTICSAAAIIRTPDVPYPNTWLIPQSRTDQALHTRLQSLRVDVEYGTELLHLSQNESGVTARITTADGVEEISARYLVGADGGSSAVRRQLGVGFAGSTDGQDRMLTARERRCDEVTAEAAGRAGYEPGLAHG